METMRLLNVFPTAAMHNVGRMAKAYIQGCREIHKEIFTRLEVCPQTYNLLFCEFGLWEHRSPRNASTCDCILHVLSLVAHIKMCWVYAARIVALVKHKESGRNWAVMYLPGHSVRIGCARRSRVAY